MRFTKTDFLQFLPLLSLLLLIAAFIIPMHPGLRAQSLDIPVKGYGISFGNSTKFTGIRLNFRDHRTQEINGINITLWSARENDAAVVNGISVGLMPEAAYLRGIQIGALGVSGRDISGVTVGLIGVGSGDDLRGISIGGVGGGAGKDLSGLAIGAIGVGAGRDVKGIALGGIGAGTGENFIGIGIGGIGVGCGNDLTGIAIGGVGAGAGNKMKGVAIGGLGAGCGADLQGIAIGGLGAGAGNNVRGILIGGLGAGCGNELAGIAFGGIGAGAPFIKGVSIGGLMTETDNVAGVTLATAWNKIKPEGSLNGFSAAAFNQIRGRQNGVSVGILNYARQLRGLQIGLINYVRDNPKGLKALPLINARFN